MSSQAITPYKEAAIFFGIVIPLLMFGAVAGGAYYFMGNAETSMAEKSTKYRALEMNRKGLSALEGQISKRLAFLPKWDGLMSKETSTAFVTNLREISEKVPQSEFAQTTIEPSDSTGGLGGVTAQPSSQMKLSTRGTYQATQKVMLQLETAMPQLQLQEFKVDPNASSGSALNFQFNYTIWEK